MNSVSRPEARDDLPAQAPLLRVADLEVTYGRSIVAVQSVSLAVGNSQLVAVLGANGAGKSTLLRAVSGFLPSEPMAITHGEIQFAGHLLNGKLPHEVTRLGIALIPERDKIFATLTVDENLRTVGGTANGDLRKQLLAFLYDLFPSLATLRRQKAGYLSGGERQMLAIAKALLLSPRLLLADELSLGLAPALVSRLMHALRVINEVYGTAILIVDQNVTEVLRVARYLYVLETGRVVWQGSKEALLQSPHARAVYLATGTENLGEAGGDADLDEHRRSW